MSKNDFDALRTALVAAKPSNLSFKGLDIEAMKARLQGEQKKYDDARVRRSFTADTLMRSYNM